MVELWRTQRADWRIYEGTAFSRLKTDFRQVVVCWKVEVYWRHDVDGAT